MNFGNCPNNHDQMDHEQKVKIVTHFQFIGIT